MTMKVRFDGDWAATVMDDPLRITPRFGHSVDIAPFANVMERERFLADTFGSQDWLWGGAGRSSDPRHRLWPHTFCRR
ncbi:hypothetical protein [Streptomyces vastus]|uniref:Uncharacterized protein n=1 Tax=Streptomyces vastus TaxID=285451 RepID=A0ABP6CSF2_9ACTN